MCDTVSVVSSLGAEHHVEREREKERERERERVMYDAPVVIKKEGYMSESWLHE